MSTKPVSSRRALRMLLQALSNPTSDLSRYDMLEEAIGVAREKLGLPQLSPNTLQRHLDRLASMLIVDTMEKHDAHQWKTQVTRLAPTGQDSPINVLATSDIALANKIEALLVNHRRERKAMLVDVQ